MFFIVYNFKIIKKSYLWRINLNVEYNVGELIILQDIIFGELMILYDIIYKELIIMYDIIGGELIIMCRILWIILKF